MVVVDPGAEPGRLPPTPDRHLGTGSGAFTRTQAMALLDIAEAVGPRHLIVCLLLLNGLRVSEGCSADIDELRGRYVAAPNKSPIRRFRSYVAHELVDCKSCRLRTQCLGCSLCVNQPSLSVPFGARV